MTRNATETVHGQHQAVDKIDNQYQSAVFGNQRPQSLEGNRQLRAGGGGGGRGVLVEKLFCSFFNPLISLYIYYDQYEKIRREKKFPVVGFHGNGGHIRF